MFTAVILTQLILRRVSHIPTYSCLTLLNREGNGIFLTTPIALKNMLNLMFEIWRTGHMTDRPGQTTAFLVTS